MTQVGVTFDSLARALTAVLTRHHWTNVVKVLTVCSTLLTYLLTYLPTIMHYVTRYVILSTRCFYYYLLLMLVTIKFLKLTFVN